MASRAASCPVWFLHAGAGYRYRRADRSKLSGTYLSAAGGPIAGADRFRRHRLAASVDHRADRGHGPGRRHGPPGHQGPRARGPGTDGSRARHLRDRKTGPPGSRPGVFPGALAAGERPDKIRREPGGPHAASRARAALTPAAVLPANRGRPDRGAVRSLTLGDPRRTHTEAAWS